MKKILGQLASLSDQLDLLGYHNIADEIDNLLNKTAQLADPQTRFWAKVKKGPSCWIWTGARSGGGYGICTVGGKNYSAHRLAWQWANHQDVPPGQVLLHTCDNPLCVNPQHLTPGTQQNNVSDRVNKGRSARGKNNGRARLKKKDVKRIKSLRNKGWTEGAIAKLYGVGRSTISNILHGRTWGWF